MESTTRRGIDCPECSNDIWELAYDYDAEQHVLRCINCSHTRPHRSRKAKVGGPRQTRIVERIVAQVQANGTHDAEVRQLEHGGKVWISLLPKRWFDESVSVCIGPRGAIKAQRPGRESWRSGSSAWVLIEVYGGARGVRGA